MTISEFEFDRPTSAAQAIERATSILRSVGADPHQIAFWRLSQHSKLDPANANIYEDASEVIEWRMTQPQPPDLTQTPATVALRRFLLKNVPINRLTSPNAKGLREQKVYIWVLYFREIS